MFGDRPILLCFLLITRLLEAGVLVKIESGNPSSDKLSGLTPGISYCSVESAVS
jgi:hypothetical protein